MPQASRTEARALNLFILAAGIAVLVLTMVDALWTTLWAAGHAGPLSRVVILTPRRLVRRFTRAGGTLSAVGPFTLVCTVTVWMFLVWLGWSLVFLADPTAVVRAGEPAETVWDIFYYAGFTVFSLGVGDLYVTTPAWQMATVLAVGNGLFVLTVAVTYILSVISDVVEKRTLATKVLSIGGTPQRLVVGLWKGSDKQQVVSFLGDLAGTVSTLAEQHFAYPVLHAYRPPSRFRAPPVAIVVLDEALTIAEHGLHEELRPDPLLVARMRSSIAIYLDSLEGSWVRSLDTVPPVPSLDAVREAGLPVVDAAAFEEALEGLASHRCRLYALLEGTAWTWKTVYEETEA